MKKFLTYTLAISLILTALPVQVFAQEEKATQDSQEVTREKESDPQNQAIDRRESEEKMYGERDEKENELEASDPTELEASDPTESQPEDDSLPLSAPRSPLQGIEPPIIIDPPAYDPPTFNTDPKSFLNSFQGKADVSLFTGELGYSFPLFVPQGRGSMTPTVNLNYSNNDSRFAGMVGYGWNLTTNSIYHVAREGVDKIYEDDNYFGIDLFGSSQQLMVINEAKGQYRAKDMGDGMKYEFDKETNQWFVQDTQGTTYTFGTTETGRQVDPNDESRVFKWMLQRVEDVHGNFMTFTYTNDQNAVYPKSIRYTGFGADPGIFEVKFILEDRSATYADYKTAFRVGYGKQVDQIQLWSHADKEPELKMTYDLSYLPVNAAVTLLSAIQVKSGQESLPATTFEYFDGTEVEEFKKLHALKTLHLPYGGENTFTYQSATAYREPDSSSSNWLPFVTYTLKTKTEKAGPNEPAYTTTYDYRRGHYYFDHLDAYKREYAGFGKVTVTDPVENKKVLYFHQSEFDPNNEQDAQWGEFDDHISKKGRIYRQETYDTEGKLLQETITMWDKKEMPQGDAPEKRFQVFQAKNVMVDHGENPEDKKAGASSMIMDDYGNPLEEIDYGEVELLNAKGEFNDVGEDKIRMTYEYAYGLPQNLLSFPQKVTRFGQADQKIGETKIRYDNLAFGKIEKGNWTTQERLVEGQNNWITFTQNYSPEGLPKTFSNPRGFSTLITYESNQLYPQSVTNAKGHQNIYVYDLFFGSPIALRDANGHDSQTILDAFGRVKIMNTEVAPDQLLMAQSYDYDLESEPVTITKTDHLQFKDIQNADIALTQKTFFDGLARPIQVKSEAEGNQFVVQSQVYDERGLLKESHLPKFTESAGFEAIDPNDPKSVLTYDALGRIKTESNSVGTATTNYGAWSQMVMDANGHQKEYRADSRGNLSEVREFNGNEVYTTKYTYDANNNLIQITDAEGNVSKFSYDLLGRRLTQTLLHQPNDNTPATFVFSYDENGNLLMRKDAKGQVTIYSYDELDRPLSDETASSTITYTYDEPKGLFGIGRLTSIKSNHFAKAFKYDLLGRMVEELKSLNPGGNYVTKFVYAGLSQNLSNISYPGGLKLSYQYNDAGQMEAVPGYVTNLDYTPLGSIGTLVFENGLTTTSVYDPAQLWRMTSRMTTAGEKVYQKINYTYDPVGNITQILDASNSNASKKALYAYDDLDRLISATITESGNGEDYTQTFEYSPTGNILTKSDVGQYVYEDKHPQAVSQAGDMTLSYDLNGSLTGSGDFSFTYNDRGLMTASLGNKQDVEYRYDESGERTAKVFGPNEATAYVNQYFEEDISGGIKKQRKYVYVGPIKVATVQPDDSIAFHHEDHLSGANVTTDEKGNVVELADYYPYGEVRLEEKTGGYENDYLFTGQERDEETGLMYYGARYYDPVIGRFVSVDPWEGELTNPQTLNKYSYVVNNPLKYVDLTGENPLVINLFRYIITSAVKDAVSQGSKPLIQAVPKIQVPRPVVAPAPAPVVYNPATIGLQTGVSTAAPILAPAMMGENSSVLEPLGATIGASVSESIVSDGSWIGGGVIPEPTWLGDGVTDFSKAHGKEGINQTKLNGLSKEQLMKMYKEDYKDGNKPRNDKERKIWTKEKWNIKTQLKKFRDQKKNN